MFNSLYKKLVFVLLGLFLFMGVLFTASMHFTTLLFNQEVSQRLNQDLARHIASEKTLMKKGQIYQQDLKEIFHTLMVFNPSIELYLLDSEGNIKSFSAPEGKVVRNRVSLEPIQKFLKRSENYPILGDDPRSLEGRKVFSVAPIDLNDEPEGYIYIILGSEQYDSVAQMFQGSYIAKLGVGASIGGLVFTLCAGLLLFKQLTQRLQRLTADVETIKESEFNQKPALRINDKTGDEIDRLGEVFNEMAGRIYEQIQDLKKSDRHRRELVGSISHDLRTPLSSLKGYLETLLLKNQQLDNKDQQEYLKIASKHCMRLEKLVAELFELAKLDSPDMRLESESFCLEDLVQDVIQKFGIEASKREIEIQTVCDKKLPFVIADIALIERALTNLLDNAVRHTKAGDTVTLELIKDETRINIQVSDTGCGIRQHDLPHIFDRFYRAKKQRGGASEGSGLGLAITKKILELHGSRIDVESKVDVGTSFRFQLPTYQS